MLPALASLAQFAARTPGGVPVGDTARVEALLDDASALVRAEAGQAWVNEDETELEGVPDVVVTVVLTVARRAYVNPTMAESATAGPFSVRRSTVYMTQDERSLVRRAAGRPGVWSLSVTRSTSDLGDLPSVHSSGVPVTGSPEELDPFSEGWPG